jgi:hypothetical protein
MQTKRDIEQKIRKWCHVIKKWHLFRQNTVWLKSGFMTRLPPPPHPHTHLIEPIKPLLRFDQRRFHWLAMGSWPLIGFCHMLGERFRILSMATLAYFWNDLEYLCISKFVVWIILKISDLCTLSNGYIHVHVYMTIFWRVVDLGR